MPGELSQTMVLLGVTIIRAKNPQHLRAFDTSKLWWLDDAWNEQTAEWFLADETGGRIDHLLQYVLKQQTVNVPGLVPSLDWILDLLQRHPCASIPNFPEGEQPGVSRPFRWINEAGDNIQWKGGMETKIYHLARQTICRLAALTVVDWHEVKFSGGTVISELIISNLTQGAGFLLPELPALAANPNLPLLDFAAHDNTELTPYRWWAREVVRMLPEYSSLGSSKASEILTALIRNAEASHEDLKFVLDELDSRTKVTGRDGFAALASVHPNWEGEEMVGIRHPIPKVLLAPTHTPSIRVGWKFLKAELLGEALNSRDYNFSEAALEMLLRGNKGNVTALLRQQVVASSEKASGHGNDAFLLSLRVNAANKVIAGLAPALGSLFKEQSVALNGEDVPFEWLLELL